MFPAQCTLLVLALLAWTATANPESPGGECHAPTTPACAQQAPPSTSTDEPPQPEVRHYVTVPRQVCVRKRVCNTVKVYKRQQAERQPVQEVVAEQPAAADVTSPPTETARRPVKGRPCHVMTNITVMIPGSCVELDRASSTSCLAGEFVWVNHPACL